MRASVCVRVRLRAKKLSELATKRNVQGIRMSTPKCVCAVKAQNFEIGMEITERAEENNGINSDKSKRRRNEKQQKEQQQRQPLTSKYLHTYI